MLLHCHWHCHCHIPHHAAPPRPALDPQGHDSNTSPPLDTTTAFLPDLEAAGFVGEEALAEMQQQLDAAEAAAAPAAASPMNLQAAVAAAQQQQQWPLPASRKAAGLGVLLPTQGTEGEQLVQQQGEEEEEELFPGGEEPPGLFDYEAGELGKWSALSGGVLHIGRQGRGRLYSMKLSTRQERKRNSTISTHLLPSPSGADAPAGTSVIL
jgi:hypothetical protein